MDISALTNVSSDYITNTLNNSKAANGQSNGNFDTVLQSAMDMINETNEYQNAAESAQIQFALGESTSTHELSISQYKANMTLQYTVAVRDKFLESYKEIMNMSI